MELRIPAGLTSLRAATEDDIDLLVRWHADPEVARYWDDETYTHDQMRERVGRPDVDAYIVELASEPVGCIEAWREAERSGGLDMFLIPEARGSRHGPDAARGLATYLRDAQDWIEISVDPYTWNERAIRAWKRAGFIPVGKRPPDEEHTSEWLLMLFRPSRT